VRAEYAASAQQRSVMAFRDLVGRAQELSRAPVDTASGYLDEFSEALPTLQALGFSMRDFNVGMGVVPEVGATLVASVDDVAFMLDYQGINVVKLKELIETNKEKKTLVALLEALQAAYTVRQRFKNLPFKAIQVDVRLGPPPDVGVKFLKSAPAGPPPRYWVSR